MTKFYLFVIKSRENSFVQITSQAKTFALSRPFGISRGSKTAAEVVEVSLTVDGVTARGEAVPYGRYGESSDSCLEQIAGLPQQFDRLELLRLLPAGAARNAVDLALWDLEAKRSGKPVWQLAGLPEPEPIPFGYTISLKTPDEMAADARAHNDKELLKIKLGADGDEQALMGIREAAPSSKLLVDVNEGWSLEKLQRMVPILRSCRVEVLEQPVPARLNAELGKLDIDIRLCADESNQGGSSLAELAEVFDLVNVKLDKTGGLTAALKQISEARDSGLGIMVGCMVSSSLGIAPAFQLAKLADYTDLDGFIVIDSDRESPMRVRGGMLSAPAELWGYPLDT